MKGIRSLLFTCAALLVGSGQSAHAADVAVGQLNVSGNVPTVFAVQARGIPGDLDLTPGANVGDRLLGILHFKFNEDVATIKFTSDSATGQPVNGSGTSPTSNFKVHYKGTCATLDSATLGPAAAVTVTNVLATNFASAEAKDLAVTNGGVGIEEDCLIYAKWTSVAAGVLPLSGVYAMTITVTMTSN